MAARVASLAQPPHRPLLWARRGEPGAAFEGHDGEGCSLPRRRDEEGDDERRASLAGEADEAPGARGARRADRRTWMPPARRPPPRRPRRRPASQLAEVADEVQRGEVPGAGLEAPQHPTVLLSRVVARLDRGDGDLRPRRRRLARPGGESDGREGQTDRDERRERPAPHQGEGEPVVDRHDRERQRRRAREGGKSGRGLAGLREEEGSPEPTGVKVGAGEVEGRPGERRHGDRGRPRPAGPEAATRPRARRSGSPRAPLPTSGIPTSATARTGLPPISTGSAGSPHCPSARPKGSAGTSRSSRYTA